ncbi:hypothetical protein B5S33_g1572 [[Candida] boidinii]|nr:hypothetical protein B5S33_g1572 [[Candida] boidinii]
MACFKELYPENSLVGYEKAYEAGADVIETDLQLTHDGILVISHDTSTKRVYGQDFIIGDTNYSPDLENLETVNEPHAKMIKFVELCKWCLNKKSNDGRKIKLMLDIKPNYDPKRMIGKILIALQEVEEDLEIWKELIIFGIWSPTYYFEFMDGFEIINISFDLDNSIKFIDSVKSQGGKVTAISIVHFVVNNAYTKKKLDQLLIENTDLKVWFWTVNDYTTYLRCKNSLPINKLNGFITDNPFKFKEFINKSLALKLIPKESCLQKLYSFTTGWFYLGLLNLHHKGYRITRAVQFLQSLGIM